MKTYSTKANANRAAKAAGYNKEDYTIIEMKGKFAFQLNHSIDQVAELFDEAEAEAEFEAMKKRQAELAREAAEAAALWLDKFVPYNPQLLLPAPPVAVKEVLAKSVVENPVQRVWAIAEQMWGQRRKDIIAECVRQGIAYNTARTQYQEYYSLKKKEAK